jgi:hypothetical protein
MLRPVMWLRVFVSMLFAMLIFLPRSIAEAQDPRPIAIGSEIPISREEPIPTKTSNHASSAKKPAEYLSWSLFLICNNSWLRDQSSPQIAGLYDEFMGFGRAIGARHAAVWFWTKTPAKIDKNTNLVEAVDANRSQAFCEKFRLKPEDSPHVLVTTVYPDLNADIGEPVILRLGEMRPQNIEALLRSLTRQITSNKLAQAELDKQVWRLGWIQSIQESLCIFAPLFKDVKATVGVVEIKGAPAEICK